MKPGELLCSALIVPLSAFTLGSCQNPMDSDGWGTAGLASGTASIWQGTSPSGFEWTAPDVVRVPIEFRNGLPCVRCRINSTTDVWMIVDTGSQACVLESDTAHAAGVTATSSGRLHGVAGAEQAGQARLARLEIGGARFFQAPCFVRYQQTVIPGAALIGGGTVPLNVLGMNVLAESCAWMAIDYRTHHLDLGFRNEFKPSSARNVWSKPLTIRVGLPWLQLESRGATWWALIDSGSTSAADVDQALVRALGLPTAAGPRRVGVGGSGGAASLQSTITIIPDLGGLGPPLCSVQAVVGAGPAKIGSGLLKDFRLVLEFNRRTMWLEY